MAQENDDVIEPEVVSEESSLAIYDGEEEPVVAKMRQAAENVEARMRLQWEQEKKELLKDKVENVRMSHRTRLAAMIAGQIVGEGAMSSRMRASQVADLAVEYADAVMKKLAQTDKTTTHCICCGAPLPKAD